MYFLMRKKKETLRLLFQQYVEAGEGPIAAFETEPTTLKVFPELAKNRIPSQSETYTVHTIQYKRFIKNDA